MGRVNHTRRAGRRGSNVKNCAKVHNRSEIRYPPSSRSGTLLNLGSYEVANESKDLEDQGPQSFYFQCGLEDPGPQTCDLSGMGILNSNLICRGTLRTLDLKVVACRRTLGIQDFKMFIYYQTAYPGPKNVDLL